MRMNVEESIEQGQCLGVQFKFSHIDEQVLFAMPTWKLEGDEMLKKSSSDIGQAVEL